MNFLTPIGFTALLAFVVLALIYLIKPTYKTKMIPATYIWKMSLAYQKKAPQTSRLRNIVLLILQILILLLATAILVTPLVSTANLNMSEQNILIIDGSASMALKGENGESRFDRAIASAKEFAAESVKKKKPVTVIYAGLQSDFAVKKEMDIERINESLEGLSCGMGSGDMQGAVSLANEYIESNALADVYCYTAVQYDDAEDVNIVDVSLEGEWNAAILDVKANYVDNFYEYEVAVATYGADKYINVSLEIKGANDERGTRQFVKRVGTLNGEPTKVVFKNTDIYAFDSAYVQISMDDQTQDGLAEDDRFVLHGGRVHEINVQYFSSAQNNFFSGVLRVIRNNYKDTWEIGIKEPTEIGNITTKGLDLYIYEHTMPTVLPTDGVVLLVNPDVMPKGVDIELGGMIDGEFRLSPGIAHPVGKYIDPSLITVTTYRPLTAGEGFETLMKCNGESVFVVNDEQKLAVLSINLNRSNLPVLMEFPVLVNNLFEYFIPTTLEKNVYEVGEEIKVNARGTDVTLQFGESTQALEPSSAFSREQCGEYSVTQRLASNKRETDRFYVRVPQKESDIARQVKEEGLFNIKRPPNTSADIYVWLAGALLLAVCLERFLYSRESL